MVECSTMNRKFIFITGGVLSSLGKGIASASIAFLLEAKGLKVAIMKLDPYLNVDPGTMNPFQHGEVYVTDDGAETDLDLGHYYRFSNSPLSKASNATSGQIYYEVLRRERKGDYLGKTVQVIPHITDEIRKRLIECSKQVDGIDVTIVEIGGTVGDIESGPFLEAIRQFRHEYSKDCINIHLTYVPYIEHAGEVKTKPTQHSVQKLQQSGIFPDMILCRCKDPLDEENKSKISLFCNVPLHGVIDLIDAKHSIYEVPLLLQKAGLETSISKLLGLPQNKADLSVWESMIQTLIHAEKRVTIAVVGKYLQHQDAYKSVFEALKHGGIANRAKVEIRCIESDKITDEADLKEKLQGCSGILVPGGFGGRGWTGKILAAKFARENKIPYFGICLGMQIMCVEFARNVLNLPNAHSTEVDLETPDNVISLLSEQINTTDLGGSMRLGAYPCSVDKDSIAYQCYQKEEISERHRHRYEFNNQYKERFEKLGLKIVGSWKEKNLCEIMENKNHPWMIGVQFHPEFKSKPLAPHPLFKGFIAQAIEYENSRN
jgi:CTP synthase